MIQLALLPHLLSGWVRTVVASSSSHQLEYNGWCLIVLVVSEFCGLACGTHVANHIQFGLLVARSLSGLYGSSARDSNMFAALQLDLQSTPTLQSSVLPAGRHDPLARRDRCAVEPGLGLTAQPLRPFAGVLRIASIVRLSRYIPVGAALQLWCVGVWRHCRCVGLRLGGLPLACPASITMVYRVGCVAAVLCSGLAACRCVGHRLGGFAAVLSNGSAALPLCLATAPLLCRCSV